MSAIFSLVPSWLWAALLAAMAAVSCGQQVQLERSRTKVATMQVAIAAAETRAAEQANELLQKVSDAQNEAKKRESSLRAVADGARAESDGLRGDIDVMRAQLAGATQSAAVERAAAVATILQHCSRQYSDLAARADRHANDVRTLIEAWPK